MIYRIASVAFAIALLTGLGAQPARAAADQPDTCATATTPSAKNTWHPGAISSASDVDWFRFSTTSWLGVVITLGDLPANYRLDVYSSCSRLLATSDRVGTQFEDAVLTLRAGTYRVRVSSSAGASSATNYNLRFRTFVGGIHVSSLATPWTDPIVGSLQFAGEIYNNTGSNRHSVRIVIRLYDAAGAQLRVSAFGPFQHVMKARSRTPFRHYLPTPAGYHHFTISVTRSVATKLPPTASLLQAVPGVASYDSQGIRHDLGTIKNTAGYWLDSVKAVVALYNRRGGTINVGSAATNSELLDPGQVTHYEVLTWPPNANVNRARVFPAGSRCAEC